MSRRNLKNYLKKNNLINISSSPIYSKELNSIFGNNTSVVFGDGEVIVSGRHQDGHTYILIYKQTGASASKNLPEFPLIYNYELVSCSLPDSTETEYKKKSHIVSYPMWLIDTIIKTGDNEDILLNWLTAYFKRSHALKVMKYNKEHTTQPSYPDNIVSKFQLYKDPYNHGFGHKTNRLLVTFDDGTEQDISLYKFKRFIKREFSWLLYDTVYPVNANLTPEQLAEVNDASSGFDSEILNMDEVENKVRGINRQIRHEEILLDNLDDDNRIGRQNTITRIKMLKISKSDIIRKVNRDSKWHYVYNSELPPCDEDADKSNDVLLVTESGYTVVAYYNLHKKDFHISCNGIVIDNPLCWMTINKPNLFN